MKEEVDKIMKEKDGGETGARKEGRNKDKNRE